MPLCPRPEPGSGGAAAAFCCPPPSPPILISSSVFVCKACRAHACNHGARFSRKKTSRIIWIYGQSAFISHGMKYVRRSLLVISCWFCFLVFCQIWTSVSLSLPPSVGCKRLEQELPLVNTNLAVISSQLSSNDNRSAAHTCVTDSITFPQWTLHSQSVSEFICECVAHQCKMGNGKIINPSVSVPHTEHSKVPFLRFELVYPGVTSCSNTSISTLLY